MKLISGIGTLLVAIVFNTVFAANSFAASILYIHGDVASDGTTPSGNAAPYDQMLLGDTGAKGLSKFKSLVEAAGHSIDQQYDAEPGFNLTAAVLDRYDVVIFGLHQKIWALAEKTALDEWLRDGGGMMIYSDSASGGFFREVPGGAQNTVGQSVTNNLIAQYGMQVTVDQADGVRAVTAEANASIVGIAGKVLKGEGVSPVAVPPGDGSIEVLIEYDRAVNQRQNITIANPVWAALALKTLGNGHIAVMFDRQPMWNNGPGSDIEEEDNTDILRALINFLAPRPGNPPVSPPGNGNATGVVAPITILLDEDSESPASGSDE